MWDRWGTNTAGTELGRARVATSVLGKGGYRRQRQAAEQLSAGWESQPCPPGRCTLRRFPSPSDAPNAWTSRRSRPKMHVQPSNHHRPSVRRVGTACQKPRRHIDPVEGMEVAALGGCIACTVNGCDARPRSSLACSSTTSCGSLGAHQHRQGHPERRGPCAVRPVLEEGEPWRKDRSQARPRLRSTPSAR
jgi:hypothetical protein